MSKISTFLLAFAFDPLPWQSQHMYIDHWEKSIQNSKNQSNKQPPNNRFQYHFHQQFQHSSSQPPSVSFFLSYQIHILLCLITELLGALKGPPHGSLQGEKSCAIFSIWHAQQKKHDFVSETSSCNLSSIGYESIPLQNWFDPQLHPSFHQMLHFCCNFLLHLASSCGFGDIEPSLTSLGSFPSKSSRSCVTPKECSLARTTRIWKKNTKKTEETEWHLPQVQDIKLLSNILISIYDFSKQYTFVPSPFFWKAIKRFAA